MDEAYRQPSAGEMGIVIIFPIVIALVYLVAVWRIFTKAGKPGWAVIVPFYNFYVLMQIIGRPGWWILLYFIPGVNLIISLINSMDLARVFGKSSVFGVIGLWLFGFIGYLILGFGKDQYVAPDGNSGLSTVPPKAGEVTPQNKPPVVPTPQPATEKPLIQDVSAPANHVVTAPSIAPTESSKPTP